MTAADMLSALESMLDQIGLGVWAFWNTTDLYDALNNAQRNLLMETVTRKDWDNLRRPDVPSSLVVIESATDGNPLANQCEYAFSCWDATNLLSVPLLTTAEYSAYLNQNLPNTLYACVDSTDVSNPNIFRSIPTGKTLTLNYLKPLPAIDASHDCQLSAIMHPRIVQEALTILLSKDVDTPIAGLIETYRDQLAKFKIEKLPQSPYQPTVIPYQNLK